MPSPRYLFGQGFQPPASAQSLASGPVFNYSASAGGNPTVPNPSATQLSSIGGNQAALGPLSQLATNTTALNAQIGQQPYVANLPNYLPTLNQLSGNALSLSQGRLPSDVVRNLTQSAAERGIGIGSPGSPNANASLLQSLGLTGLQLQQQGLSNFGSLMNLTPTGPQFNPSSFYVTPEQMQQAQSAANLYNAAPIPAYAQQANLNALNQGYNRGFGGTAPGQAPQSQSGDLVNQILQRYSGTALGTPQSQGSPVDTFEQDVPDYYAPLDSLPDTSQGFTDPYASLDEMGPPAPTDDFSFDEGG